MLPRLLIIGQHADLHVQSVVERLKNKFEIYILDQFVRNDVCLNIDERRLQINEKIIDFDEPILIWNRIKLNFSRVKDNREETPIEKYVKHEWINFCRSIEFIFPNCIAFNKNESVYKHEYKSLQLSLARDSGFLIPKSFFANINPNKLEQYAIKPLFSKKYLDKGGMFTEIIDAKYLDIHADKLSVSPIILQDYVHKASELRILATRFGSMGIEILSQESEINRIDWRRSQRLNEYRPYCIDDALQAKIFTYLKLADLHYGVFDVIINSKGEYVFVECNADGQWLGYADMAGLKDEFVTRFVQMVEQIAD